VVVEAVRLSHVGERVGREQFEKVSLSVQACCGQQKRKGKTGSWHCAWDAGWLQAVSVRWPANIFTELQSKLNLAHPIFGSRNMEIGIF
jgi:hypothetical protein